MTSIVRWETSHDEDERIYEKKVWEMNQALLVISIALNIWMKPTTSIFIHYM